MEPDDRDVFDVDAALVRAARRGDTIALATLVDRLAPYVGRICAPIALDSAADATQDALIAVVRSLPTMREPRALRAYTRTVAVREAVRHARRDARTRPVDPSGLTELPAPEDPQLRSDIRAVLDRLAPHHRAVLVLRDLEGFDEAAAAELLNVPTGTVKSRLSRARRLFRKEWTA